MTPKVTVVIPTVGRESLTNAVESALQNDANVEVIVVVDIPDLFGSICERLKHSGCRVLLGANKGGSSARNIGMKFAQASYICFLDDDDQFIPHALDWHLENIASQGDMANVVSLGHSVFHTHSGKKRLGKVRHPRQLTSVPSYLVSRRNFRYRGTYFSTSTFVLPLAVAIQVGWDENLDKHQDWDFLIRLSQFRNIVFCYTPTEVVSIHQGSPGSISKIYDFTSSLKFLKKHELILSRKARSDFALLHLLLPAMTHADKISVLACFRKYYLGVPHLAAFGRFMLGLVFRR